MGLALGSPRYWLMLVMVAKIAVLAPLKSSLIGSKLCRETTVSMLFNTSCK